jgi:hypothetical protein
LAVAGRVVKSVGFVAFGRRRDRLVALVAIPDYQTVMLPLLRTLQDGAEWKMRDVTQAVADWFGY